MRKDGRPRLNIGASRVRTVLCEMPEDSRAKFVETLWPHLSPDLVRAISRYPGDMVVNGAQLILPESWKEFGAVAAEDSASEIDGTEMSVKTS